MRQADSGQRINTDSCVFGDCLRPLPERASPPSTCLDIGCGTGLLAIMLAAKFPTAKITALEPATEIAAIARENAASCPWHDRIHVETKRLQDFICPEESRGYDLIACNPPFFQNSQISSDTLRAIARHDVGLSATDVGTGIARLLAPGGTAWLLCATADESQWIRIFDVAGLCQAKAIQMKDHPDAKAHATAIAFHHRGVNSKNKTPLEVTDTITYRDTPGGGYSGWMQRYRQRWHPF